MYPTKQPYHPAFDGRSTASYYGESCVDSPPSSNGSLVCTPYHTSIHVATSSTENLQVLGSSHQHHDVCMISSPPAGSVNGLGLVFREPSPLGAPYEQTTPRGFHDIPMSLGYRQEQDYSVPAWDTPFPTEAGPTHHNAYAHTSARSHTHHNRSYSESGGGGAIFTPPSAHPSFPMFSQQTNPYGLNHDLEPLNRSLSLPPVPGNSAPSPPGSHWNNQYNSFVPDYHGGATPSASASDNSHFIHTRPQRLSPSLVHEERGRSTSADNMQSSSFQARVGSERTRAISHARRTNPDKPLFHCDFPDCGATITSKHNFKSHMNSHLGIKNHACGQGGCEKRFGTSQEAKRHRLNHCQFRA